MNPSIFRFVSLFAISLSPFAMAATRHVPSDYGSIQSAINAADPGDVVQVAAGTYAEQLVISKPLTLIGPQVGVSGADAARAGDPSSEAVLTYPSINFSSPSSRSLLYVGTGISGVTIEGFSFRDVDVFPSGWYGYLIFASNVQDLVIRNNRFFGGQTAINAFYTTSQTGFTSGMIIERNHLDGGPFVNSSAGRGISIQGTAATVQDNIVLNSNIGIEVAPYGNPAGGVVQRNQVSAGYIGLLHGRHDKGGGAWSWQDNSVTVAANDRTGRATLVQQPWLYKIAYRGIQIASFGTQGSGGNPAVSFSNNTVDGSSANSTFISSTDGLRLVDPYGAGTIQFADNTIANVTHGVDDTRVAKLDLSTILTTNTFPAGMIVNQSRITFPPPPIIITAGTPSALSATYGSPSVASSFLLYGSYLREGITVTAPIGFEVSASESGPFAASTAFGSSGTLNSTSVYVRLAAGTPAGTYPGNLVLTTAEGAPKTVSIASSTVARKPLAIVALVHSKWFGDPDPALTYASSGLLFNDALTGSLSRAPGEATGTYPIGLGTLDAGPNYQILFTAAEFTIVPLPTLEGDFDQDPVWSAGFGGELFDNAAAVVPAADGGAWVLGDFEGAVSFGSTTLQSAGGELSDLALVRINATGQVASARAFGGASTEFARCATAVNDGGLVIGAVFNTATTIGTTTLNSAGSQDIVIASIDASGNALWAKRFGGSSSDHLWAITADVDDNLFLTGQFSGSITFGSTTLTSSGGSDGYVAKLDASGNVVWAHRMGGTGNDIAYAVALDDDGRIAVAGQFNGSGTFGSHVLSSAGGTDGFATVLDPSGTFLWAKRFGGTTADVARAATFDMAGSLWVAGQFTGSSASGFGDGSFTSAGSEDIFVVRMTALNGNLEQADRYGGSGYDIATALATDPYGSVVLAGNFNQTIAFGVNEITSAGGTDTYLAKLHPVFGERWAQSGGGSGSDSAEALAINGSGEILLAGRFDSVATFGAYPITGGGNWDLFVTKINGVAPVLTSQPSAVTADLGDPWELTASYLGAEPATFQWFKDGSAIDGANSIRLASTAATAGDAGQYSLQISSPYGTATTQSVSVVVRVPAQTISVETISALAEGRSLEIPIYLTHSGSISGIGVEIPFNQDYLANVAFNLGPSFPAGKFTVVVDNNQSKIRVVGSAYPSVIPVGKRLIGTITATVRSVPQGASVVVAPVLLSLSDDFGSPITSYTKVSGASISVARRDIPGDSNNNGRLDVSDAAEILRLYANPSLIREWDHLLNDLNGDGLLTEGDATRVHRVITRLDAIPDFGGNGTRTISTRIDKKALKGGSTFTTAELKLPGIQPAGLGPAARLVLTRLTGANANKVLAQVFLDDVPAGQAGLGFAINYPADVLRIAGASSLIIPAGGLPANAAPVWNVLPGNQYANQSGTVIMSAAWGSGWTFPTNQSVANLVFEVNPAALSQVNFPLTLGAAESAPYNADGPSTPLALNGTVSTFTRSYADWAAATLGDANASTTADSDGDGMSNTAEYAASTDPTDAGSALRTTESGLDANGFTLRWHAAYGVRYQVSWSENLVDWNALTQPYLGQGSEAEVTDPTPPQEKRFYRVEVVE